MVVEEDDDEEEEDEDDDREGEVEVEVEAEEVVGDLKPGGGGITKESRSAWSSR